MPARPLREPPGSTHHRWRTRLPQPSLTRVLREQDRRQPGAGDEQAGAELDEDGEADGPERVHGRGPRPRVVAQPQALREVDAEHEAEERADDGDDEEADDSQPSAGGE